MKSFYLQEIITKDGLMHQGIFYRPEKSGKKAILWMHGLTGKFYGDVAKIDAIAHECDKRGWGFASFNNRGHDLIASMRRVDPSQSSGFTYAYGGGGYEIFEDCVWDIQAGVDFLVSQGFSEVILVGHSTGAIKVCYSEGKNPHENVVGVVLTGGLSDRLDPALDKKEVAKNITRMEQLISEGKGNELVNGLFYFPMTPTRYVSLFKKGSTEDIFDYDDKKPRMTAFSAIAKPLFVIISEADEYLDRPAADVISIFDATMTSKKYKSLVFPKTDHSFSGKEKELAGILADWSDSI